MARLTAIPNVVLQISLDSHLATGNGYRVPKDTLHDRIVAGIAHIIESGIPVEIYSVKVAEK